MGAQAGWSALVDGEETAYSLGVYLKRKAQTKEGIVSVTIKSVSDDELILEKSALSVWIIGGIFLFIGFSLAFLFGGESTLECRRISPGAAPNCVITRQGPLSSEPTRIRLAEVRGVTVDRSTRAQGKGSYQIRIHSRDRSAFLSGARSLNRIKTYGLAEAIESFLKDPSRQEFLLVQDERFAMLVPGGLIGLLGLAMILFTSFGEVRLSISENKFEFETKSFVGKPKQTILPLSELETATVEEGSRGKDKRGYRISLVKTDGTVIPLSSSFTDSAKSSEKVARKIRAFLAGRPEIRGQVPKVEEPALETPAMGEFEYESPSGEQPW